MVAQPTPKGEERPVNWSLQELWEKVERGEMDRMDAREEFDRLLKSMNHRKPTAFLTSLAL